MEILLWSSACKVALVDLKTCELKACGLEKLGDRLGLEFCGLREMINVKGLRQIEGNNIETKIHNAPFAFVIANRGQLTRSTARHGDQTLCFVPGTGPVWWVQAVCAEGR